jgi:hypothetical protein
MVASFAAGVRELAPELITPHTGALIATFRSRCAESRGAFAEARHVVTGDAGGRVRMRMARPADARPN